MSDNFTPLLLTTDWNEEWQAQQASKPLNNNSEYWNKRAQSFTTKDSPNSYVDTFLKRSGIEPGETVLDMGCGNGALSIPLGKLGYSVIAADFSSGMLDSLKASLEKNSIDSVTPLLMSWDDDWDVLGVNENCVDLAFASRSIATDDLKRALLNLDKVARRKACVTLATEASPRIDVRIIEVLGLQKRPRRDFQYALNILINEGKRPELSYIKSSRKDSFDSLDEAVDKFENMLEDLQGTHDLDAKESRARLQTWLKSHLIENPEVGQKDERGTPEKAYCLKNPRHNTWAFISWETG